MPLNLRSPQPKFQVEQKERSHSLTCQSLEKSCYVAFFWPQTMQKQLSVPVSPASWSWTWCLSDPSAHLLQVLSAQALCLSHTWINGVSWLEVFCGSVTGRVCTLLSWSVTSNAAHEQRCWWIKVWLLLMLRLFTFVQSYKGNKSCLFSL